LSGTGDDLFAEEDTMRKWLSLLGICVGLSMQITSAGAQIVPPFTSFTPGTAPGFVTPPHPHPPVPVPTPIIGTPFWWGGTDYSAPAQSPDLNVVVNPAPEPPPPPVVYNPPSTEITPSGAEVVRLMSTSPAR
jgi:hypothetical protein